MAFGLGLGIGFCRRFGPSAPPVLVADFVTETYRKVAGTSTTFDGLLTHARMSNATMVDSDGLLKWAPHNLLTYSEQFDNPAWTNGNSTDVANQGVAPDGTTTADLVYPTTSGTLREIYSAGQTLTGTHTMSVYVKSSGFRWVYFSFTAGVASTTTTCFFDVVDGVVGTNGLVYNEIITPAGDGWFRISITIDSTATSRRFNLGLADADNSFTATANGTSGVLIWGAHLYRSDLGGMVNNPDTGNSYVPTTSAARYLPRRGHHVYNGSEWVNEGLLVESEARTNLLLNSGTLSTQSVTVAAVAHTLSFTGTGTVTLSGASTAGPLVGTGTGESNRVSLTFTPSAGSLTLTVTGTVTNAQLEEGSTPSSYISTAGQTSIRAADAVSEPSAVIPYNASAMSGAFSRLLRYADTGTATEQTLFDWRADANNRITITLDTAGANTGKITLTVVNGGSSVSVTSTNQVAPGLLVDARVAWRVTTSEINIALNSTAATAVSNTAGIPNLSAASATLGGTAIYELERMWAADLGDAGIAEASA